MFGGRRKKIAAYVIEASRPYVASVQHMYGLPPNFWADEFVLGFFGIMVNFLIHQASGGRISQTDRGFVMHETFRALSNMSSEIIVKDFARLAQERPENPRFKQGADNAALIAMASTGQVPEKGRHLYEEAQRLAQLQGTDDHSSIVGMMIYLLYSEPVREHFFGAGS